LGGSFGASLCCASLSAGAQLREAGASIAAIP